jgi:hypothetical protein
MWLYFILRNGWLIFHGVTPHFLLSLGYLWDDWIAFPGSIRAFSWDQNCFFSLSMRKDGVALVLVLVVNFETQNSNPFRVNWECIYDHHTPCKILFS